MKYQPPQLLGTNNLLGGIAGGVSCPLKASFTLFSISRLLLQVNRLQLKWGQETLDLSQRSVNRINCLLSSFFEPE